MRTLRLSPRAAADLEQVGDYIAQDNIERAATFVQELEAVGRRIVEHPEAYPLRPEIDPEIRVAVHGRYLILFRILPDQVRVERVLHGARDLPRTWRG